MFHRTPQGGIKPLKKYYRPIRLTTALLTLGVAGLWLTTGNVNLEPVTATLGAVAAIVQLFDSE